MTFGIKLHFTSALMTHIFQFDWYFNEKLLDHHKINRRRGFGFDLRGVVGFAIRYKVLHCALWICEWPVVISLSVVSGAHPKFILQDWPRGARKLKKATMKPNSKPKRVSQVNLLVAVTASQLLFIDNNDGRTNTSQSNQMHSNVPQQTSDLLIAGPTFLPRVPFIINVVVTALNSRQLQYNQIKQSLRSAALQAKNSETPSIGKRKTAISPRKSCGLLLLCLPTDWRVGPSGVGVDRALRPHPKR